MSRLFIKQGKTVMSDRTSMCSINKIIQIIHLARTGPEKITRLTQPFIKKVKNAAKQEKICTKHE